LYQEGLKSGNQQPKIEEEQTI